MRVCFISHSAGRYGAELALVELLQGLLCLGVEVLVLIPKKGPLLDELERLNIEWRIVGYPVWMSRPRRLRSRVIRLLKTALMSIRVAWIIRKWNADVVYTNTVVIGVGALAARLLRRPHVWHSHESLKHNPSQKFDLGEQTTSYLLHRLSAAIIATSHSVKNDYKHLPDPDKIRVVYQSVTPCANAGSREPVQNRLFFQCVIIGSLHPWKGQDQAISALAQLTDRNINAHLLLVGDDGRRYRAQLVQQAKDLDMTRRLTFYGYAEDPLLLIRNADVVLVCSRWEAFGRVAIEAMLAGKPVIGSARGATTEIIQHGQTGLLYEWGNIEDLTEKIQFLHDNPEEARRIGHTAQQWAANRFTQNRYAQEILDILSEVAPNLSGTTMHHFSTGKVAVSGAAVSEIVENEPVASGMAEMETQVETSNRGAI
ncbi:glycosyltransferase involved in cell wall biosynthesis [Nitrosospira sp. Nsp5]|uniref:Glycosyltransferase involved in cell wall bisynthesis n=1 Tax=Nitrosospira multiformis TaxID=1231 RepID=A0ABY0TLQ9_9PROT|nr:MULTISPECIES: glycosyltransferase family 4 protein [Nitrosospira]PTR10585.1 glycosyltransferase involved in cell wall biosynthesis [Nitrosospira sp. Nsp5]SDQ80293.1 Glycosyltransferase involved in cell wall bisynthesis [Nitrosospira multiformis]